MNMPPRAFKQVDVFTAENYRGNALAVVLDASHLSDQQMQRFARWTNLSETTFVLPPVSPEADYRVRIFTPGDELPFAGHPTLGSCHAWLESGGRARHPDIVIQECQAGLVRLRRDGGARLAFAAPSLRRSDPDPAVVAEVAAAVGVPADRIRAAQVLDNGPVWLALLLDSPATVLGLSPHQGRLRRLGHNVGVAAVYAAAGPTGPHLEVRGFAAPLGIAEDPVTGSLNASLAQWLMAEGLMPARYVAAQGACLDRAGRVHLERDATDQVWAGGTCITCIEGSVRL
jgi:PhzF family phenazine biosynthesis protein